MMLLLSLFILFLIGLFTVNIFWTKENIFNHIGLKACIAFGIGSGITSIIYFFQTLFYKISITNVIVSEIFILLILAAILFYKKPIFKVSKETCKVESGKILNIFIPTSFYLTAISSFLSFVIFSLKSPHGNWDAWTIWNLHARFIYRLSGHVVDFFRNCPDWAHPDYPLLIPAAISRFNQYSGHEQLFSAILVAGLFAFGLVFLLVTSISALKTKNQGYLAGMVMLSTFVFIQQAATQCADIPIAFFFLATLVLLCLKDKFKNNSLLILAGITAGLSAWCKNEGLLFIISIFLAHFAVILAKNGFKTAAREVLLIFSGLFPVLILLLYIKFQLFPPNDIFANRGISDYLSKITNPARYAEIFSQLLINIKYYFCRLTGIPLLAVYALLAGINIKEEHKTDINTVLITLCLMLAGYLGIYVITPHNLYWHLSTSLYRLLLQLWPGFILLYFMIVKTPEENFKNS